MAAANPAPVNTSDRNLVLKQNSKLATKKCLKSEQNGYFNSGLLGSNFGPN